VTLVVLIATSALGLVMTVYLLGLASRMGYASACGILALAFLLISVSSALLSVHLIHDIALLLRIRGALALVTIPCLYLYFVAAGTQGYALPKTAPLHGLWLLGGSDEVQKLAGDYINIRILGAPAALANFALIGFAIGTHNTRVPLKMTVLMHSTNALLDVLLVQVWHLDVRGVAIASATAEYVGLAGGLFWLLFHSARSGHDDLERPEDLDG